MALNQRPSIDSPALYHTTTAPHRLIIHVMILIVLVNSLQDISSTMSVTWECISNGSNGEIEAKQLNLEQRTQSCAYLSSNLCIRCFIFFYSYFLLYVNALCNLLCQLFSLCAVALTITNLRKKKRTFYKVIIN